MKSKHLPEFRRHGSGLLVSVRCADEALAALAGGADVVDIKEPARGALGAADASTIAAVVRAVAGRAPVTAALGELTELHGAASEPLPAGVALFKLGLAGCRAISDWRSLWRGAIADASPAAPVAVAYADWRTADAPPPDDVLQAAVEAGCPALLIDTWCKASGGLFDHWPQSEVADYLQAARAHRLLVVLAGSLMHESFAMAARLAPDLVAVRTAACGGDRRGVVSAAHVRRLAQTLRNRRQLADRSAADRDPDGSPKRNAHFSAAVPDR